MDSEEKTSSDDTPKSFQDRMASVMDAITAACPTGVGASRQLGVTDDSRSQDSSPDRRERSPLGERRHPRSDFRDRAEDRRWQRDHDARHDRSHHRQRHEQNRHGGQARTSRAPFKPDYVKNPSKWTKYDLTNDGTKELRRSGMSADQVNKYAAFEFLNTLKKVDEDKAEEDGSREEGKVVFKKPTRQMVKESAKASAGREVGGGYGAGAGVRMMGEYVVGGEKEKEGKAARKGRKQLTVLGGRGSKESGDSQSDKFGGSKKSSSHGVSLSHLDELDEVDDT